MSVSWRWSKKLVLAGFAVLTLVLVLLTLAPPAQAHEEREVTVPDGSGKVPAYRDGADAILVCKSDRADFERRIKDFPEGLKAQNLADFNRCQANGFRHVQEAVDKVKAPGVTIRILPGVYLEEPGRAQPKGECAKLPAKRSAMGYQVLSYEQQRKCPHNQNLIGIFGVQDLQIEGTGAAPQDVIIDGQYRKLNVIRGDMTNGLYLRNFSAQRSTFNSIYILATDGFVIDKVLTRWNDEYGFLTFASDHGVYQNCESYGNGDSGIYPGSASNLNDGRGHDVTRYAIEIKNCKSHHSMTGYSGTAGDSVWAHDNEFSDNMSGIAMDSLFPGHPGLPQNHAKFERNNIHDNNQDYVKYIRDGTCKKPPAQRGYEQGVVCPQIGTSPGTGIITAGGNYNTFKDNWIYNQDRAGVLLLSAPAILREEKDLNKLFDTSHHNVYIGNKFGVTPAGKTQTNNLDVWWDGQGTGNCWQSDAKRTSPATIPRCGSQVGDVAGPGTSRVLAEPIKLVKMLSCAEYNASEARVPAGCDWFGASGLTRVDVQVALGLSVALLLLAGLLWWGLLLEAGDRGKPGSTAVLVLAVGLALAVPAPAFDHTLLPAIALVVIGAGWILLGMAMHAVARRAFGWATIIIGILALVDALDKSVVMLPWLPVGPAWIEIVANVIWVPWAVIVIVRRRRPEGPPAPEAASAARAAA